MTEHVRPSLEDLSAAVRKLCKVENRSCVDLLEEAIDGPGTACICTNKGCNSMYYAEIDTQFAECHKCGTETVWSIMELVAF